MKASEANLLEFLSKQNTQFIIPIYQRTYSWTRAQCQQLWNDIFRVATDQAISAHFVGSIVYIQEGLYHATSIHQMLVIDGQQRLTTVSLLLLALAKSVEAQQDWNISREQIFEQFIINKFAKDDWRYKLILTQSDKDTLISLADGHDYPSQAAQRVKDNYEFFTELIRRGDFDPDTLFNGIKKLVIVDVSLDRNYDNPQLIFESLNSTGLDLSQADLIRNYVLMGMPPAQQEGIYRRYWFPMEQRFGHAEYASLFDRFMRDYLTIKSDLGTIPNIGEVYVEFKKYVRGRDITEVVADIALFSRYFVRLAFPERNEDAEIRHLMHNINTLKVDVAYPLLLEVFDDYERNKLLSQADFIDILRMVESYVFRRAIVGIPTNSMNKTFATFKRSIRKEDYLNSVTYGFVMLDSYRRFPRDEEFWNEFVMKDIYNLRQRRNYMLSKLENYERREWVNIEEYTIEHIMPQNPNLSTQWQHDLGPEWQEIQKRYLHTIGNLTLTGYNPELSDRPFLDKRDMEGGFADSPFRLNRGLNRINSWGAKEINDRAQALADLALRIWEFPTVDTSVLERYQSQSKSDLEDYSLANFDYLQGDMLTLFDVLRTRILNMDASVREEVKKNYIAYKTTTNFVDIVPQKARLRLSLNMTFDEVDDPQRLCRDITDLGRWGNGDVEVGIASTAELDYIMFLIRQAFEKHTDEVVT